MKFIFTKNGEFAQICQKVTQQWLLSHTESNMSSESVESGNFIEKFDPSWVSQSGPSGYQQGKFGNFCQKCLWPVWRTSQCWNHWDHPRSYVYSMYSFQGRDVDKALMHKFVLICNFAQNYGTNEYKQGLTWQFETNSDRFE